MDQDRGAADRGSARGKVTLTEIAAHAGVSRSTVSLVLRKSPLVADTTRARVRAAIEALGYVYDRGAARMRGRRSDTVGLVVVDLTSPFYAEFIAGVDAALDAAGRLAFIANTGEDPARQWRVLERFREHAVDGVILCPAEGAEAAMLDRIGSWGLPCVQALRFVPGSVTDYAGTDNSLGTEQATEHLIGLGHRRVVFVGGGASHSVARDRMAGYRTAMLRHGLEPATLACRNTLADGTAAIRAALSAPVRPTAAVCFNDPVAMGVIHGVRQAGLRPGADLAVVGFDSIADAALWVPSLTTVAIQPSEIGCAAANLLMRRIADPTGAPERSIVAPRLVVRESSGPALSAALASVGVASA
ncbi:LacI family DNA-binding transcriptional regulator [Prosthecomicrobium sp. N25]|uniref:LacI family DNA-binding transcriptional regulator n=1 Tax=Prosthecomicrobium sp. N25 TaxID=3129254 RepID=UPI003076E495